MVTEVRLTQIKGMPEPSSANVGKALVYQGNGTFAYDGNIVGPTGPTGPQGEQGIQGETGSQGIQGEPGVTIDTAAVDNNGYLQITLTDDTVINAGNVVGPKGDQGDQGVQGIQGETGNTGDPGLNISSATVNGNGELIITLSDNSTVNAGYVVGPQGEQGAAGSGSGDVLGPSSATDANITLFDGSTGKYIKDSGYALTDFAAAAHNHDTVYYTETEVDTLLAGKSDINHNHDTSYYTQGAVDTLLDDVETLALAGL